MTSRLRLCLAFAAAGSALSPAHGAVAFDDDRTIIVNGQSDGYRTILTRSGTKTEAPMLDIPQSISVVTSRQITDQAIRSIGDLTRLLPGISAGQGEGHRDQVTLRGNNSTADFFVDGLRDDVQYYRSFYNIERVEAHKGPNAMIFGRGGGGGLINRVTKSPVTDSDFARITGSLDSFASGYAALDANLAVSRGALRLNAFREHLDTHRDQFDGERWAINPVAGFDIGATRFQLGYEHVADTRVIDRGVPSAFAGSLAAPAPPLADARNRFFGDAEVNRSRFNGDVASFRSDTALSEALTFSTSLLWGDYAKDYRNAYAATPVGGTPSAPTVGIEAYQDLTDRRNLIAQANLVWATDTGPISHVVLFGLEHSDQSTRSERINGWFDPVALTSANRRATVSALDPVSVPPLYFVAGPGGSGNRAAKSQLSQQSVYLQDQIGLGAAIDLIAGLRYDRLDLEVTNLFAANAATRVDTLWSPRLGLVAKPTGNSRLYASWTRSYLPQSGDQFSSLDATSATLTPEIFDNYEIGAKWEARPGLTLTAALYRLDRGNSRAAGPTPGSVVLTGAQRSEGVEIDIAGRLTRNWQVSAGYAYTDASIRRTTSAAPAGRAVAQVPRHQFSLWNRVELNTKLGVGAGLYHQSRSFATISNATLLPAYTRIDAAAYLRLSAAIELQLNIENLANETYFPNAHNDNNISTGAPRNVRLTLTTRL